MTIFRATMLRVGVIVLSFLPVIIVVATSSFSRLDPKIRSVISHIQIGLGAVAVAFFLFGLIYFLLNQCRNYLSDRNSEKNFSKYLSDLEGKGLLATTYFRAVRAFQVRDYDDEDLHYFLELENGSVLYLSGSYLYEYEPCDDDPELNQPRLFPCTEFTLRQTKKDGVLDLQCRGTVLEPEIIAPALPLVLYGNSYMHQDGKIFTDISYNDVKQLALAANWDD